MTDLVGCGCFALKEADRFLDDRRELLEIGVLEIRLQLREDLIADILGLGGILLHPGGDAQRAVASGHVLLIIQEHLTQLELVDGVAQLCLINDMLLVESQRKGLAAGELDGDDFQQSRLRR